jgi:iron complex transport system substrate-binding protein
MKNLFFTVFVLLFLTACQPGKKTDREGTNNAAESVFVKYARGFTVKDFGNYKLVDVSDPSGESEIKYHYAFIKRGSDKKEIPSSYEIIETPVSSVICMTTLQLSNFIKLNQIDKIVGMPSTRFLFNPKMKEQLKSGTTKKIGIEGEFDEELIIALNPDVILVSPFKRGGYESIRNLDIPLVGFLGYKELTPLGQAEWIKFTGMLLGIEEQAEEQFNAIEERYITLKKQVANVAEKPTVLSGELHAGNWYVVGGKSYLAQLFQDAGAAYFMPDNDESGGFYLDFETVYSKGAYADYWRMVNSFDGEFSYEALKQTDVRYGDFKAVKEKQLIYCNLREKPFYENSPVEPEIVLADLIHIFHPELLPEHQPVFYDLLKK